MPITRKHCPQCKIKVDNVDSYEINGMQFNKFQCGHYEMVKKMTIASFDNFVSKDGKRPMEFQKIGALFAIKSNARCLIADEMRLGKTIQALMTISTHESDLKTVLVCCKRSLTIQWMREAIRWCGPCWTPQIIDGEDEFIFPAVKMLIVSYDTLWRFKDIEAFIKRANIKCAILDEVQNLKNSDSKRTNGVRKVCQQVEHVIALSGTPIMNHAGEYFPILNMLYPAKFPTKQNFDMRWVDTYWNGRKMCYGGLKDFNAWSEYTKDFIIRRKRDDVLKDFPKTMRDFRFCDLGQQVEQAYVDEVKNFQAMMNNAGLPATNKNSSILAYLARMRHLTGIAKIEPVIDYALDFVDETDRKLVIFIHHLDVAAKVYELLSEKLPGQVVNIAGLDDRGRVPICDRFEQNKEVRVMIASTIASSEGLNWGFCSDYVMLEREWNPGREEQAESRFPSVTKLGSVIQGMYLTAVGTIDEFFAELVEKKRSAVNNTLDGSEVKWDESSLITELAEIIQQKGGQKWGF